MGNTILSEAVGKTWGALNGIFPLDFELLRVKFPLPARTMTATKTLI